MKLFILTDLIAISLILKGFENMAYQKLDESFMKKGKLMFYFYQ